MASSASDFVVDGEVFAFGDEGPLDNGPLVWRTSASSVDISVRDRLGFGGEDEASRSSPLSVPDKFSLETGAGFGACFSGVFEITSGFVSDGCCFAEKLR